MSARARSASRPASRPAPRPATAAAPVRVQQEVAHIAKAVAAVAAGKRKAALVEHSIAMNTKVSVKRMMGLPHAQVLPYAKKLFAVAAENEATLEQLACGDTQLAFFPDGFNRAMIVRVEGKPIKLAPGTIWVQASAAQRSPPVCQLQVQHEPLEGAGELSATFFCGNISLPCAQGIQFIPSPYQFKGATSQQAVWQAADPKETAKGREQALKSRLSKMPVVMGSGGTETLAKITAVSGRWLEVQTCGNLRAHEVLSVTRGWAQAFLERGPWRGVRNVTNISKMYDVAVTVEQYYVPDGGNGDGGFWILGDATGSIKKKDLVGVWLSVAFMPSMGLPKVPHRAAVPPKDVIAALGAEACLPPEAPSTDVDASAGEGGSSRGGAGGDYWTVEEDAKRARKESKAALHSGASLL